MNLKEKRIMILKEVDRLLKLRCDECWGDKNMLCDCAASKAIRRCGEQLNELLTARVWDKRLGSIEKRQTITLSEYIELLNYGVTAKVIAEILGVQYQRLSAWCNYYGLTSQVRKSKEKTNQILDKNGNSPFLKDGFNYEEK